MTGRWDEQGYWLDPWSLFFIEVILVQFAELKRWQDYRYPGSQGKQYFLGFESWLGGSGKPAYPGVPFTEYYITLTSVLLFSVRLTRELG